MVTTTTTTTTLVVYLTLVLAVSLCSLDMTAANMQCKTELMKLTIDQCGHLGRSRRDLNEALTKTERKSEEEIEVSRDENPVKRQLGAEPKGRFGGMEDTISEAISADAHRDYPSLWATEQFAELFAGPPPPYPMALAPLPRAYPGSPHYYVEAPGLVPSLFQPESRFPNGFLPPETGGDLDFDLSSDELDELYVAISNRIRRNSGKSQAELKRSIIQAAAKCCQNIELCRKERPIIACV